VQKIQPKALHTHSFELTMQIRVRMQNTFEKNVWNCLLFGAPYKVGPTYCCIVCCTSHFLCVLEQFSWFQSYMLQPYTVQLWLYFVTEKQPLNYQCQPRLGSAIRLLATFRSFPQGNYSLAVEFFLRCVLLSFQSNAVIRKYRVSLTRNTQSLLSVNLQLAIIM
jgi:hypothetical protein